ncbi:hypothetical protein [Azospirillum halopraeferens]|uniref:hypothetical protein n=1 Tax=Azospirillum halopraeferens TaxID=34010 RepID=UPI00041C1B40|nr:hypothetical protein [Azospirillum halopraeferens]
MLTYRDMVAFYSGPNSREWEAVLSLLGHTPDDEDETGGQGDRPRSPRRTRPGDLRTTRPGRFR